MSVGGRAYTESIRVVLEAGGFDVSRICCSRPSCFDFAARKGRVLIFVKSQRNIGNVPAGVHSSLRLISEHIPATGLLISEKAREKTLEDDTVYSRHDVLAITPKTLENVVQHDSHPLIQAGPGGYYIRLDGEAIRDKRMKLGLSIGQLAEALGTSRRTLYSYENGVTRASVPKAWDLIRCLGIPAAKPINIFRRRSKRFITVAKKALERSGLCGVFSRLARCRIVPIERAPFDVLIHAPKAGVKVLAGIASRDEQKLETRASEILSVGEVVGAHAVLVAEDRDAPNKDIHCIRSEELSRITSVEELVSFA